MTRRLIKFALLWTLAWPSVAVAQRLQRYDKTEVLPMADVITTWTNGAATGNFGTAGNWTNGVPDNSRDASANEYYGVFDGNVNNDPVILGLDQNGVTCSGLIFRANYGTAGTDMLGSSGNPLLINILAFAPVAGNWSENAVFNGKGNYYYESGNNGDPLPIVVNTPLGPDTVTLAGTIRDVLVKSGRVNIIAGLSGTNLTTSVRCLGPQAIVTLGVVAVAGPIFIDAGKMTIDLAQQGPVQIRANGGLLIINKVLNVSGTVPSLNIDGGNVLYRPDTAPAQTVELNAISGILDLSELRFDQTWGPVLVGPDMEVVGSHILSENIGITSFAIDLRKDEP